MKNGIVVFGFVSVLLTGVQGQAAEPKREVAFKPSCNLPTQTRTFKEMNLTQRLKHLGRGRILYKSCTVCHPHVKLPKNNKNLMKGPALTAIYNRKAGADPDYKYRTFRSVDFTWNEVALNLWLSNPIALHRRAGGKGNGKENPNVRLHAIKCNDNRSAIIKYLQFLQAGPEVSLKIAKAIVDYAGDLSVRVSYSTNPSDAKAQILLNEAYGEALLTYYQNAFLLLDDVHGMDEISKETKASAFALEGILRSKNNEMIEAAKAYSHALSIKNSATWFNLRGDAKYCYIKGASKQFRDLTSGLSDKLHSVAKDYENASKVSARTRPTHVKHYNEKEQLILQMVDQTNASALISQFESDYDVDCETGAKIRVGVHINGFTGEISQVRNDN